MCFPFRDYGSGFCILNDLAVTALELRRRGAVQRVLILDLDVHQVHLFSGFSMLNLLSRLVQRKRPGCG